MDNIEKLYEYAHLEQTIGHVQDEIDNINEKIDASKGRVLDARRYMWDEAPRLVRDASDANELAQGLLELKRVEEGLAFYAKEKERLDRLKHSPYFARIDVDFQGDKEMIYIGVTGFTNPKTRENLIYDWRTPIASLFYDYPIGKASYLCDAGTIEGEITLKRQFRIEKSKIVYMFDSSLNIEDEMLQEILSQSTDGHLRDIVMTIQKEQNQAIRDDSHKLVIVWGAGGSGKTSIALHRIAYLLYRNRNQLNADNIVIFSPSDIFQDYISDVLPDLGEENVKQTTFQSLAKKIVNLQNYSIERPFEGYEYLFSSEEDINKKIRKVAVKYKNSPEFLELLENYLIYLEDSFKTVGDFIFNGEVVLSGEEFYNCVKERYSYLPFKRRLEKLERRLIVLLEPLEKKRQEELFNDLLKTDLNRGRSERDLQKIAFRRTLNETAPLKERISWLIKFDLIESYLKLFKDLNLLASLSSKELPKDIEVIAKETIACFNRNFITKEDLAALAFLKQRLESFPPESGIRHVVIDEVQDYSATEIKVLAQAYADATFTVLGDPNQALLYKGDPKDYVLKTLQIAENSTVELLKSYRSTEEITVFAKAFADEQSQEIKPVLRHGKKPEVIISESEKCLLKLLEDVSLKSYRSIAVITKTASSANDLSDRLRELNYVSFNLIEEGNELLPKGIVILPVYLAKGLEFDVAIVWKADEYKENERRLLYIATTRALHELYLIQKEKGDLLQKVDPQSYTLSF